MPRIASEGSAVEIVKRTVRSVPASIRTTLRVRLIADSVAGSGAAYVSTEESVSIKYSVVVVVSV